MLPNQVCILGGSGFIGTALARQLSELGVQVVVPTRYYERARHLLVLPTMDVQVTNVRDKAELAKVIGGCDAVVNLIGVLHPEKHGGFDAPHVEFPRAVVKACAAAGVRRLVHMSALCAESDAPSEYLRSKARGEAAVRAAAAEAGARIGTTVLRPSIVFGRDDKFMNMFAWLTRWFPLIPLGSAQAQFQPIHVEDVARVIVTCLQSEKTTDRTYSLCGPKVYTLRQLVDFVATITGRRSAVIELGPALALLQAAVFEHLPGKLITRDNVRSMSVPNVCAGTFPDVFGFQPAPMENIVPHYLAGAVPRGRYPLFRHGAGRKAE